MNARQVLNKLIDELPPSFCVFVTSQEARHPSGIRRTERTIYVGVYDENHVYYESESKHISGETWAEALEKYEATAKEHSWK